jgi:hypothetical protein
MSSEINGARVQRAALSVVLQTGGRFKTYNRIEDRRDERIFSPARRPGALSLTVRSIDG